MACGTVVGRAVIASRTSLWSALDTSSNSLQTPSGACHSARHFVNPLSVLCWTKADYRDRTEPRQLARRTRRCASDASSPSEEAVLPDLQVPREWVAPEAAAEEAEWLRGALKGWLDEEFCPEPANEEISRRCAKVYYYCLLEEQLDVGDILMQMVRDLETFSFKESFHGAFSSANAAIDLITRRMRARELSSN